MTPLEAIIRAEIEASGPMPIDRFMTLCLAHPQHGYYMTRDPFGVDGDFVTAPEISQMFGELVGLWLAQAWIDLGQPAAFQLVELGPGRGTLLADALRAAKVVPGFQVAAKICLLETSPTLKATQQQTLSGMHAVWLDRLDELEEMPTLFVANEFFDALPIRQFQKIGDVWMERFVGRGENGLEITLGKTDMQGLDPSLADGAIVETSTAQLEIVAHISKQIASFAGAALIFDYGDVSGHGDTLQAVRGQSYHPVLAQPGEVDLTAHVNFGQLAKAIGDCAGHLTTQGQFLKAMGIDARAKALAVGGDAEQAQKLDAAIERLTADEQMGSLFKVMAITQLDAATPAGF